MSIGSLRAEIDEVDDHILALLRERVTIAMRIAKVKRKSGLSIRDRKREQEILDKIASRAGREGLNPEQTRRVFKEIIELSVEAEARP